jgi:large subunit ribosomal protein L18
MHQGRSSHAAPPPVRKKVRGTAERPRLAVFRSNKHVYAQVIDDVRGRTLASASTIEKALAAAHGHGRRGRSRSASARRAAKAPAIETVVLDRGGFKYHGRVAGVTDAAREAGLRV